MYAAVVVALLNGDGPDISGKNVPMLAGTSHLVSMRDIEYFRAHPDMFTVVAENVSPAVMNATGTALLGVDGLPFQRGPLADGVWMIIPTIFRLRLTGTGTVTLDAKDSLGNITTGVASFTASGATDQIEFPYAGDNAVAIMAHITGLTSVEVI